MVTYPWGWKSTAVKVQTNCLWNSFTGGTCRNDDVSSMVGPGYSFSGQECVNTDNVIAFSLYVKNNISWIKLAGISLFPIFCIPTVILNAILCFHSRGQHPCKFIVTKESVCIRKEFNSHRTGFWTHTWPPFHCFGTQIWPPQRHAKTHNWNLRLP